MVKGKIIDWKKCLRTQKAKIPGCVAAPNFCKNMGNFICHLYPPHLADVRLLGREGPEGEDLAGALAPHSQRLCREVTYPRAWRHFPWWDMLLSWGEEKKILKKPPHYHIAPENWCLQRWISFWVILPIFRAKTCKFQVGFPPSRKLTHHIPLPRPFRHFWVDDSAKLCVP